jgi:hypothetical protein
MPSCEFSLAGYERAFVILDLLVGCINVALEVVISGINYSRVNSLEPIKSSCE